MNCKSTFNTLWHPQSHTMQPHVQEYILLFLPNAWQQQVFESYQQIISLPQSQAWNPQKKKEQNWNRKLWCKYKAETFGTVSLRRVTGIKVRSIHRSLHRQLLNEVQRHFHMTCLLSTNPSSVEYSFSNHEIWNH